MQDGKGARYVRKPVEIEGLKHNRDEKRLRRNVFIVLLLLIIIAVFLLICFKTFFRINKISVDGNAVYAYDEIIENISFSSGDGLYSFSADDAANLLKRALPYISTVKIERSLPSTVNITVEEKTASMYIKAGNDTYLLSDTLDVLERIERQADGKLIHVELGTSGMKRCVVGEKLSTSDERTAQVVTELYAEIKANEIETKIKSIDARSRFDITLMYEDKYSVYIGNAEHCSLKLRFLKGIVLKLYEDSRGKIDVSGTKSATFSPYT